MDDCAEGCRDAVAGQGPVPPRQPLARGVGMAGSLGTEGPSSTQRWPNCCNVGCDALKVCRRGRRQDTELIIESQDVLALQESCPTHTHACTNTRLVCAGQVEPTRKSIKQVAIYNLLCRGRGVLLRAWPRFPIGMPLRLRKLRDNLRTWVGLAEGRRELVSTGATTGLN